MGLRGKRELKEKWETEDLKVHRVTRVPKDKKDHQGNRVSEENRESEVPLDSKELVVLVVRRGKQVSQESQENRVHLVKMACPA